MRYPASRSYYALVIRASVFGECVRSCKRRIILPVVRFQQECLLRIDVMNSPSSV